MLWLRCGFCSEEKKSLLLERGRMVKTGIKIFARLRPTKKTTGLCEVEEREDGLKVLSFTVPRSEGGGAVNNKRETYSFRFSQVFDARSSQDEVFNEVSRGVIDNCLEGYNGTIFAYGQTGSGKTFTITGGVERYSDRGLIPRTLSYLYQQYEKSPGTIFTTHISYLEIYNECGYDLLDPRHEASHLEDLPKVTLMEDRESVIHLRNLSLHPTNNEEEALNWLFLGDTNRMMAETPMNMASTRSHCIFTIHISSRQPGSDTLRRAKLHLVDLAGSERVGKTGMEGALLTEAKYINLSLHFLEQVIVALSDKSRSHIPYRNSMMTSVLRDSLGGNCMTSMIATCSVERKNIDESISTCRFSQRVALVKNEPTLNEELDPKLVVRHLKQQVADLTEELCLATGEERVGELEQAERERCEQLVASYLEDESPEARLLVGGDMRKIQLCFSLLKARAQRLSPHTDPPPASHTQEPPRSLPSATPPTQPSGHPALTSDPQLQKLEEVIRQRDEEISILLKMLKQEQHKVAEAEAALKGAGLTATGHTHITEQGSPSASEESPAGQPVPEEAAESQARAMWKAELSRARQEAFDSFRKDGPVMASVSQHKTDLKTKYAEAKALGERVNTSRTAINKLKTQLERYRISRGLAGLTGGVASDTSPDERELEMKRDIETEKTNFKSLYQTLRGMKTEIEHVQHLLERSKVEVQRQFEEWWQRQVQLGKAGLTASSRAAWKTPPTSTSSPDTHPHSLHKPRTDSSGQANDGCLGHHRATTDSSGSHRATTDSSGRHRVTDSSGRHRATTDSSGRHRATNDSSGHPKASVHSVGSSEHTRGSAAATGQGRGNVPLAYRAPGAPQPLFPATASPMHTHKSPTLSVPLTGDERADADIMAFYRARQRLIAKGQQSSK